MIGDALSDRGIRTGSNLVFWGREEPFAKPFRIMGTLQETGEQSDILLSTNLLVEGTDDYTASAPFEIQIPQPGLWKLDLYIGDSLLDHLVIEVK